MGKILLRVGLGFLVLGGLGVFLVHRRAAAEWRAMDARAHKLQKRFTKKSYRRPALWGETVDGDGWADYEAALGHVAKGAEDEWRALVALRGAGDAVAAASRAQAFVAAHELSLHHLRRGAHRGMARPQIHWERGLVAPVANLLQVRAVLRGATEAARAKLQQGQDLAAAHYLLDGLQLGRDLVGTPRAIDAAVGVAAISQSLAPLEDLAFLAALDDAALTCLARGMMLVDRGFAVASDEIRGETLLLIRELQQRPANVMTGSAMEAWRYGFSRRLMWAFATQDFLVQAQNYESALQGDPAQRVQRLREQSAAIDALPNPASRGIWSVAAGLAINRLEVLAKLRVARAAVAVLRGLPKKAVLADPFGGVIRVAGGQASSIGPEGDRPARLALTIPK